MVVYDINDCFEDLLWINDLKMHIWSQKYNNTMYIEKLSYECFSIGDLACSLVIEDLALGKACLENYCEP